MQPHNRILKFVNIVCPNPNCSDYGRKERNNIIRNGSNRIRRRREQKFICRTCKKFFTDRAGLPYSGLRSKEKDIISTIDLAFNQNLSLRDISEKLNIKLDTVRKILKKSATVKVTWNNILIELWDVPFEELDEFWLWVEKRKGLSRWQRKQKKEQNREWKESPRQTLPVITFSDYLTQKEKIVYECILTKWKTILDSCENKLHKNKQKTKRNDPSISLLVNSLNQRLIRITKDDIWNIIHEKHKMNKHLLNKTINNLLKDEILQLTPQDGLVINLLLIIRIFEHREPTPNEIWRFQERTGIQDNRTEKSLREDDDFMDEWTVKPGKCGPRELRLKKKGKKKMQWAQRLYPPRKDYH